MPNKIKKLKMELEKYPSRNKHLKRVQNVKGNGVQLEIDKIVVSMSF